MLPGGGPRLEPLYAFFGQVTEGLDIVAAIGELGGPDERPTTDVIIESVTITETPKS